MKQSTQPLGLKEDFAAWLGGSIDVKPPDGVICWDFEKLHIQLNILQTPKRTVDIKRARDSRAGSGPVDMMLFGISENTTALREKRLERLENVVQGLRALPNQISSGFRLAIDSRLWPSNQNRRLKRSPLEITGIVREPSNPSPTYDKENPQFMLQTRLTEGK